jgi:hypothetical protein
MFHVERIPGVWVAQCQRSIVPRETSTLQTLRSKSIECAMHEFQSHAQEELKCYARI